MKTKMVCLFLFLAACLSCDEDTDNPSSEIICEQDYEVGVESWNDLAGMNIWLTPIPESLPTVRINGTVVTAATYRDSAVRWEGGGPYQPGGSLSYSIAKGGEVLNGAVEFLPQVTSVTVNGVPVENRVEIELPITSTLEVSWDGQGSNVFYLVYKEDGEEVLRGYHEGESYTQTVSSSNIGRIYFYIIAANREYPSLENSEPDRSSATMCVREYVHGHDFRCEVAFTE